MYSADALRKITRTACLLIDLWSPEAEELLLGTIAQESNMGRWLRQMGGGPARGLCQVEPKTEFDNWKWLNYRVNHPLREKVKGATGLTHPDIDRLEGDPIYNIIQGRIWYRRCPGALPPVWDRAGQANYWNDQYNRNPDYGHTEEYLANYERFISCKTP